MLQRNPDSIAMPAFNMAGYFEGRTRAWGMFETITGKVKKSFVADIEGRWDGRDFLLEEDFTFSDGEKESRVWRLKFSDDGSFQASCADTPSPGKGVVTAMRGDLAYSMALRVGGKKVMLSFSDLFYQIDENTVLNRAKVKKFGIPVGQVLISFRKA
ncbi:DUF3833 family protein [Anderseniella sp. Alg231-50]|uniref:DUF3833 family protein n=1 Tax=Anderseniella sp. Alg231-50 TaxID=1922226 RepID=UPI000D552C9F